MEMKPGFLQMIRNDIDRIDCEVRAGTDESRWVLFRELDGRYQTCVENFYRGMWQSSQSGERLYFPQLKREPSHVIDNLKLIKAKLETFCFGANAANNSQAPSTQVNLHNNTSVSISFEQASKQVEEMTSLTNEETEEILDKISEIQRVVESKDSKKSKWEQIKPVLKWLADKSYDLGKTILPLLLKIEQ